MNLPTHPPPIPSSSSQQAIVNPPENPDFSDFIAYVSVETILPLIPIIFIIVVSKIVNTPQSELLLTSSMFAFQMCGCARNKSLLWLSLVIGALYAMIFGYCYNNSEAEIVSPLIGFLLLGFLTLLSIIEKAFTPKKWHFPKR